jgi:hypothetical protein
VHFQLRRFTAASLHNHGRPRGAARDARHGILDHYFVDPQASWTVPAQVIANGGGVEFMITFFRLPSRTPSSTSRSSWSTPI